MHSKEVILKKLSNYTPLKYNQFYWWRNWGPKNKPLFNSRPLLDRIKNGDFDFSIYYWQALYFELEARELVQESIGAQGANPKLALAIERKKRLWQDFERDEPQKLQTLQKEFLREFKMTREEYYEQIEDFSGDLEEFYYRCEQLFDKKPRSKRGRPKKYSI